MSRDREWIPTTDVRVGDLLAHKLSDTPWAYTTVTGWSDKYLPASDVTHRTFTVTGAPWWVRADNFELVSNLAGETLIMRRELGLAAGTPSDRSEQSESEATMPGINPAAMPADPAPSDVIYDDMARAWRNKDYPLAWSLADALLQYLANGGEPLTDSPPPGHRDLYWARQIYIHYAPLPEPAPVCTTCGGPLEPSSYGGHVHRNDNDDTHTPTGP